ncbi:MULTISPECIES: hypothetical protein [Streptomyces]|uniref:Uncharacterized protein n=1 Tax=Streptomyces chartreusis NRRL 3882 TaxID=1079985 RepID=A0A2N9B2I6_STRCX|nr:MULTISPECIES: hypothetical protein [Streptomyces]MYS93094.1 hypothetical protein [Streptomyces sp. SID5464]SOR77548.1 hypothetical protein SCNRRL3882_1020 [Streptomyces chartreusis NRRL 3882]
MNRLRWGVALSGWMALAATALPAGTPLRVATTSAFLLVGPGLAATLLVRRKSGVESGHGNGLEFAVLTVALSLALSTLVAEILFLTKASASTRALLILAVLTSVLALTPAPPRAKQATRRSSGGR